MMISTLCVERHCIRRNRRFDASSPAASRERFRQLQQFSPETTALPRVVDRDSAEKRYFAPYVDAYDAESR
jgi:hypothetical protein